MSDIFLSPLFTWRSAISSENSRLEPTSRLVALSLSLHMNERGGSCFPSIRRLARETALHNETVQIHLDKLEKAGWLKVARGNAKQPNHYTATVPDNFQPDQEGVRTIRTGAYGPSAQGVRIDPIQRTDHPRRGRKEDDKNQGAKRPKSEEPYARLPEWNAEYREHIESLPIVDPAPIVEIPEVKAQAEKAREAMKALKK